jgi:DNA-directed RNA polymerase sigma subunit (sigma70/sigma32)
VESLEHRSGALMDQARVAALVARAQGGDRHARVSIVEGFHGLANYVARSYRAWGIPHEDLVQEAFIGILQAIDHFDASRGLSFANYATWWMRAYITRNALRQSVGFSMPPRLVAVLPAVRRAEEAGHTDQDIAVKYHISLHLVRLLHYVAREPLSLELPVDRGHDGFGLTAQRLCDMIPAGSDDVNHGDLPSGWDELDDRERAILELRYGFFGSCLTLRETGERLHLTAEWVRVLEGRAMKKLRQTAAGMAQQKVVARSCNSRKGARA